MAAIQIKKMASWHESIVDWELENPDRSMKECALFFDVTENWLSVIRNSDVFEEYRAMRRQEHNSNVSFTVLERTERVADIALEVLEERIQEERYTIGLSTLNNTAGMALKALGFGPRQSGREAVQVNIALGSATPESLSRAREMLHQVNMQQGAPHEPKEIEVLLPTPATA